MPPHKERATEVALPGGPSSCSDCPVKAPSAHSIKRSAAQAQTMNVHRGVTVELTWPEMMIGLQIGGMRRVSSLLKGRENAHGFEGDGWAVDIEGALAELACAKALNVYGGLTVGTFKQDPDIAGGYEVRAASKDRASLIIRTGDDPQRPFILVVGIAPRLRIVGWITGHEARRDEWWRAPNDRPAAWFVPQINLRSLSELPSLKGALQ